jgi:hypothetical protein
MPRKPLRQTETSQCAKLADWLSPCGFRAPGRIDNDANERSGNYAKAYRASSRDGGNVFLPVGSPAGQVHWDVNMSRYADMRPVTKMLLGLAG